MEILKPSWLISSWDNSEASFALKWPLCLASSLPGPNPPPPSLVFTLLPPEHFLNKLLANESDFRVYFWRIPPKTFEIIKTILKEQLKVISKKESAIRMSWESKSSRKWSPLNQSNHRKALPQSFQNHVFVWGTLMESWSGVNTDARCPGEYATLRFTRWLTGIAPGFHPSIQAERGGDVCYIEVTHSRLAARNQVFHPNSCWEYSIERYSWKSSYNSLAHDSKTWLQAITMRSVLGGLATSTVSMRYCSFSGFISWGFFSLFYLQVFFFPFFFLTASSKVQ